MRAKKQRNGHFIVKMLFLHFLPKFQYFNIAKKSFSFSVFLNRKEDLLKRQNEPRFLRNEHFTTREAKCRNVGKSAYIDNSKKKKRESKFLFLFEIVF